MPAGDDEPSSDVGIITLSSNMQPRSLQQQQPSGNNSSAATAVVVVDGSSNTTTNNEDNNDSLFSSSNTTSSSTGKKNSTYDENEEHIKESLEQDAKAYLNSFPPQPETKVASTTYTTFSDPKRFSSGGIRAATHYLTNKLRGVVWLDANSDGVRGSSSNRTRNAMEYDVGVGGAKVELVHCDTDEILVANKSSTTSSTTKVEVITFPYEGGLAKRTDVSAAGIYEFPLYSESSSFVVPPGRYYVMFTAPRNFRIIGNMLPLDRKQKQKNKQSTNNNYAGAGDEEEEDTTSVVCTPFGGEGNAYRKRVEMIGDLDWEGHCGRSIGCFDVGKSFELKEKYPRLKVANDNQQQEDEDDEGEVDEEAVEDVVDDDDEEMDMEDYVGTMQNIIALPSPNTLNVGFSQDDWPLGTVQFADVQLTVAFPSGTSDEELTLAQTFAANNLTRALQESLTEFFHEKRPDDNEKFDILGVDLHGSRVIDMDAYNAMQEEQSASTTDSSSGRNNNACLARVPPKSPDEPPPREVTYNFTIRGKYEPPPQVKLGPSALQSINSESTDLFQRLTKEISKNDTESVAPRVFQEAQVAAACHLTLEKAPVIVDMDIQCWAILPVMGDPLIECWAILPVILLSVSIAALIMYFVIRRVLRLRLNAFNEAKKSIRSYLRRKPGSVFQ